MLKRNKVLKRLLTTVMVICLLAAFMLPATAGENNVLTVDYNSGTEKKVVVTGPVIPYTAEKTYTESELISKFGTDGQPNLYYLSSLNTVGTKRIYAVRGISMWDMFADAGVGTEIYRNANYYLQTLSADGFAGAIGPGVVISGQGELTTYAGTLDQDRYTYSVADYYNNIGNNGTKIPWILGFAESYVAVTSPTVQPPANATDSKQKIRPYFGQLNTTYTNNPLFNNATYRLVFSNERLSNANVANNSAAAVFSIFGTSYDRASILTGPTNTSRTGAKIRAHFTSENSTIYLEGTSVQSLLTTGLADTDYVSFGNAAGMLVTATAADIKANNYTIVYATGDSADNLTPIKRTVDGTDYYFDLYRNGSPVVENVNALSLYTPPAVDKSDLSELITTAEVLTEADYTAESWAVFATALNKAQAVMADDSAEQESVNAVLNSLQTAMDNLAAASVGVNGVSLDKSTDSIAVGGTTQLTATVSPADADNQDVIWDSSDEDVAAVSDEGLVTGVGAGTATITVTTVDGGYTATCQITVRTAEPVTLTVLTATIVQDHLSYIHVQYSGTALRDTSFALLDGNGDIVGSAKGSNGKAVITVTAPSEPGTYNVVALLEGEQLAGDTIEVVAYNDNIWETYTSIDEYGFVVINFNEDITTKNNSLTVNGEKATGRIVGGRSIVTSVNIESLPEGESRFSVSGVKYPRLYPGYVFTFTATIIK